jgi:hypothetical protein
VPARALVKAAWSAALAFVFAGLVYNAISILRLPQSGLKSLEIIWVSITACVVIVALAMAIAGGLEQLGEALRPRPPREDWLREQVRQHRMRGIEVGASAAGETSRAELTRSEHSGAA